MAKLGSYVHPAHGGFTLARTKGKSGMRAPSAPPPSGVWYNDLFAKRDGVGVGPRVSSFTDAATWAAATAGVSASATQITITGADITAFAIDFGGRKVVASGARPILRDCIGVVSANGGGTGQWQMNALNPTIEYCRMTNPARIGGTPQIYYVSSTGTITHRGNDLRDAAGQDPIKGPNAGVILNMDDGGMFKGLHLINGAHIDFIDLRAAAPGSSIRRTMIIGDHTDTSVPADGASSYTNAIRTVITDGHGGRGDGVIIEEVIALGSDDPLTDDVLFQVGDGATVGLAYHDVLVDLREHNQLLHPSASADDWLVRTFDYTASLAAGQIVGISAPVPFPNLGSWPAAVPTTMAAPAITAGSGGFTYAPMQWALNKRSLITGYTIEWSEDGVSWTPVAADLAGGFVTTGAASNVRARVFATNGIGAATPSAASNILPSIAGGATATTIAEQPLAAPYDGTAVLSGTFTGPDGAALEYRIADATTDATVVDWTGIAGGAGTWSALATIPPRLGSVKASIRPVGNPGAASTQAAAWFSGHIAGMMGQSLMIKPLTDAVAGVTFVPPLGQLSIILNDIGGASSGGLAAGVRPVTNSSVLGLKRMAAVFARYGVPPVLLVDLAHTGQPRTALFDDALTGTSWAVRMQAPVDYVRSRGAEVGTLFESFFTADSPGIASADNSLNEYERKFSGGYTGQALDGIGNNGDGSGLTDYTSGSITVANQAYNADHFLYDLSSIGTRAIFDFPRTVHVPFYGQTNINPVGTDGSIATDDRNKGFIRHGIRNAAKGVSLGRITGNAVPGYTGEPAFAGHIAWPAPTHVKAGVADGEPMVAVYYAIALCRAWGYLPRDEPRFTSATVGPAGAYIDVTFSRPHGGALTTPWRENQAGVYAGTIEADDFPGGLTLPETTIPELHNVMGFSIVRGSARTFRNFTAEIQDGAAGIVRITPTVPFVTGDRLYYRYGDGVHLLSLADVDASKPHLHMLIEARAHVNGTGYGYPVVPEPGAPIFVVP